MASTSLSSSAPEGGAAAAAKPRGCGCACSLLGLFQATVTGLLLHACIDCMRNEGPAIAELQAVAGDESCLQHRASRCMLLLDEAMVSEG